MDLKAIKEIVASDEVVKDVTIYQKSGEPYLGLDGKPSTMGIVGSESQSYRDEKAALTRDALQAGRRSRMNDKDVTTNRIRLAACCVKRWSGWDDGTNDLPCTRDNVMALVGAADHILEQVEEAREGHARLFTNSSPKP